jgi:hypothetical protein
LAEGQKIQIAAAELEIEEAAGKIQTAELAEEVVGRVWTTEGGVD